MYNTFLTPGPSQLYFTFDFHLKQALSERIPSISPDGRKFKNIYQVLKNNLRTLLNLPDDYHILLLPSVHVAKEYAIRNLIVKESFHFINGPYGAAFFDLSVVMGKKPLRMIALEGTGFDMESQKLPENIGLIAITHNETFTGTQFPVSDIHTMREKYSDALIILDVSSSLPFANLDFNIIDCAWFSVHHGFGLPAGLAVLLVNEKCLIKSKHLHNKGLVQGKYLSLDYLTRLEEHNLTPETPNVLGVYLLSKVIEDMLYKGTDQIRRETEYKAALMYHLLETHRSLLPFVNERAIRSKTTIVVEAGNVSFWKEYLKKQHFIIETVKGKLEKSHFLIANYPTHSKESFEKLSDVLLAVEKPVS